MGHLFVLFQWLEGKIKEKQFSCKNRLRVLFGDLRTHFTGGADEALTGRQTGDGETLS